MSTNSEKIQIIKEGMKFFGKESDLECLARIKEIKKFGFYKPHPPKQDLTYQEILDSKGIKWEKERC